LWGIETVALRIFNAYGPGQPVLPTHPPVIPQLMQQILGGGSLVVHGDGQQTRDFVYIDDVVLALVASATASEVDRRVINVGSGRETSINQLIALLERVTAREAHVIHVGSENGGVTRLVADVSLARRLLGYKPRFGLEGGLWLLLENDAQFARLG
jgi:UDP-glucose 4-epimerase